MIDRGANLGFKRQNIYGTIQDTVNKQNKTMKRCLLRGGAERGEQNVHCGVASSATGRRACPLLCIREGVDHLLISAIPLAAALV